MQERLCVSICRVILEAPNRCLGIHDGLGRRGVTIRELGRSIVPDPAQLVENSPISPSRCTIISRALRDGSGALLPRQKHQKEACQARHPLAANLLLVTLHL